MVICFKSVCLVGLLTLYALEVYQIKVLGSKLFLMEFVVSTLNLLCFLSILTIHFTFEYDESPEAILMPLKLFMIFISFVKAQLHLRVYDNMSYFMRLLFVTIIEIKPLLITFLLFQLFFALCFCSMDAEPDDAFDAIGRDWNGFKIFTMCYFNSLSRLKFVKYEKFLKQNPEDTWYKEIHIEIIWILYYVHILTMFTMMLNFMVAVIDVAYRGIDNTKDI